jgi:signal transduction histidine kinase
MEANPSTAQGDAQAEADRNLGRYLRRLARAERAAGHALRGRLHTIGINLELLKHDTNLEDAEEGQSRAGRRASVIAAEHQHLWALIELLLRRVRLKDQTPEDFDFRKLVEEVLVFLGPYAAERHVRLDITLSERPMPMRSAQDPLAHAIFDAIATSIDAVERWGTVAVTVQHEELGMSLRLARGPVTPPPELQIDAEPNSSLPDWSLAETIIRAAGGTLEESTTSGNRDWIETSILLPRPSASLK